MKEHVLKLQSDTPGENKTVTGILESKKHPLCEIW